MRPILMKGHERPLTFIKYNKEGDLLFSCAKDHNPTVWFADNGERLGTYRGHNGAVWSCDISRNSTRLITGSADQTAKLWDVQTGTPFFTFNFDSPARSVDFAVGDKLAVITTDPFMGLPSAIHVKTISRDPDEQIGESVLILKGHQGRINRAVWGPLNKTIISAGEDSVIRIWDSETGKVLEVSDKEEGHQKPITSLSKSADGSHILTGSLDKSAKLWDTRTLTLVKTYVSGQPVNAVTMSPLLDHIPLQALPAGVGSSLSNREELHGGDTYIGCRSICETKYISTTLRLCRLALITMGSPIFSKWSISSVRHLPYFSLVVNGTNGSFIARFWSELGLLREVTEEEYADTTLSESPR